MIVALPGDRTCATLSKSTGLLSSYFIAVAVAAALRVHCNVTMAGSLNIKA